MAPASDLGKDGDQLPPRSRPATTTPAAPPAETPADKGKAAAPASSAPAPGSRLPLLIALVGLPARGKTSVAHRLARFLAWGGAAEAEVFAVDDYRRKLSERLRASAGAGAAEGDSEGDGEGEAEEMRRTSNALALADALEWLRATGAVAVLDGTHETRAARRQLRECVEERLGWRLLFVDCVCDQPQLQQLFVQETLLNSPDYRDLCPEKASGALRREVALCAERYEALQARAEGVSAVRYADAGESVSAHRLRGARQADVLRFLACYRPALPATKTFYFSRHGESEFNVLGRIGGDASLSPRGQAYARALAQRVTEMHLPALQVWTSQLCRTKQTAQGINAHKQHLAALNELDAGVCEGLTYEEIQDRFPQEFAWRDQDKLRYRYPWGESYIDIMSRIQSVLLDLEGTTEEVLIVSHQAVLRCILGYFLHKQPEELPYLDVPLHTLIKLTSDGYNFNIEFIKLPIDCVDTYRRQPNNCASDRSPQDALHTVPSHFDSLSPWNGKDLPKNLPMPMPMSIYIEQH